MIATTVFTGTVITCRQARQDRSSENGPEHDKKNMTMKRIAKYSLAVVVGVALGLLVSGCASTRVKRLSGPEFLNQAEQITQVNSAHWTAYIGSSSQRAYLEFGRPAALYNIIGKGIRTTVYWTELSELPEGIAGQLKAGTPPWKP